MSESRPEKRRVEFIESYWTGGELGSDYQWNDNHGELIRCRDCKYYEPSFSLCKIHGVRNADWFCADGQRKTDNG